MISSSFTGNEMVTDRQFVSKVELETEIKQLKEELSLRIRDVDMHKREATFVWEFKVDDLLKSTNRNRTPSFYCSSMRWHFFVETNPTEQSLSCYLKCEANSSWSSWSIEVLYDFTLLAQTPKAKDKYWSTGKMKLFNEDSKRWGTSTFVKLTELTGRTNSFVKNGMIKIQAHLIADKLMITSLKK